jgi:heme-degrading monooxygenase HmoA
MGQQNKTANNFPTKENEVYFIDKFTIPADSIKEFTERMRYNRNFIKKLDGFVEDKIFEQKGDADHFIILTIATWKNKTYLDDAKAQVLAEYKRIDFNPAAFYQRLNIQMERSIYNLYLE